MPATFQLRSTDERLRHMALIRDYLESVSAAADDANVFDFALKIASAEAEKRMQMAKKTLTDQMVDAYRGFYRADDFKSNAACIRPINVAFDALVDAAALPAFKGDEALREVVMGEVSHFMHRVIQHAAPGLVAPGSTETSRWAAMNNFTDLIMQFWAQSHRDAAAVKSHKHGDYVRSAAVVIYRQLQYAEWSATGETPEAPEEIQ